MTEKSFGSASQKQFSNSLHMTRKNECFGHYFIAHAKMGLLQRCPKVGDLDQCTSQKPPSTFKVLKTLKKTATLQYSNIIVLIYSIHYTNN